MRRLGPVNEMFLPRILLQSLVLQPTDLPPIKYHRATRNAATRAISSRGALTERAACKLQRPDNRLGQKHKARTRSTNATHDLWGILMRVQEKRLEKQGVA